MNRKTILSIIIFSFFVILPSYSESDKHVFGGALSISTNGVGGNLYWNPTSRWSVQAGYEQMRLRRRFDFEENDLKMDARLSYKTGGLSFTAGFQCLKWLYFKSGIALLFFNPALKAIPCDEFKFGDIYIKPDAVGSLRVSIKNGLSVSPYVGIGFGRQAAYHKRVACGFEVGTYYMGAPRLEMNASGMLAPSGRPEHVSVIESQFSKYRFYPVAKLILSIKFFSK